MIWSPDLPPPTHNPCQVIPHTSEVKTDWPKKARLSILENRFKVVINKSDQKAREVSAGLDEIRINQNTEDGTKLDPSKLTIKPF